MAQLTEEDSPSAGPSPAKILKPIFQKLTASQRADSSSVASATAQLVHESIPTQPVPLVQTPQSATIKTIQATTSPVDTPQEKTTAAQLKKVKMKSFPGQKNNNVEVLPKTEIVREKKATPLQEDRVVVCWFEYIGKMSKTERAMSMRMRDMKLEIIDANTFKVTVNNIQVAQEVKRLLPEIESHFRERIENDYVQIAIEVAEAKRVERIYSKQERYRMMLERNTALRKLTTQLDLRLN
jgi:DNA polymerase-3 subunit gamma/tau